MLIGFGGDAGDGVRQGQEKSGRIYEVFGKDTQSSVDKSKN